MNIQGKVWGKTSQLFDKNNVEVHHCIIKAGGYCLKHMHKSKFNRFVVLKGEIQITIWKEYSKEILQDVSTLQAGDECTVPPGDFHKFLALEDTELLEIYWVELDKNDIIRLDHGGVDDAA